MKNTSTKTAHLSQFETIAPQRRVVLLGASNLSLMFPTVIESTRALLSAPLEFFIAKGFGRSYGRESKFFGKKFPGILQSDLWDVMSARSAAPTIAIVSDIGNDLAYESPVETILAWIAETLDRLAARDARTVLNNIPLASLRRVGPVRYPLFRELFFPKCKLPRKELLRRAEQLSEGLEKLAQERKTPIFSGESSWYRFDPIHPRRDVAGEIWRRMLGELIAPNDVAPLVRPRPAAALELYRLQARSWSQFGFARSAAQPCARLADDTTIALY